VLDVARKCFAMVETRQRRRWLILVLLGFVASGLEMVGALLVLVLLGLVADPSGTLDVPLVGDIRRFAGGMDEQTLLIAVASGMAVFFLLRAAFQVFVTYAQHRVMNRAGARIASRLVIGYLSMPYAFHLQRNTADLIRTAQAAATTVVGRAFLPLIRVTSDAIMVVALAGVLLLISPIAMATAVVVVGGAAAFLLLFLQPRLKRAGRTAHEMTARCFRSLQQSLHGVRDVKLLGRERHFAREYASSVDRFARAQYLVGTGTDLPRHVMETALLGFILVFFIIAISTGTGGEQILSVLGGFAYVGLRLQPSLNRMLTSLTQLKFATASVDEVHADLTRVGDVTPRQPQRHVEPRAFEESLHLDHIDFQYEGTETPALSGIDLRIRPGETIGICGTTGSGKTTLVDLMTGLLVPSGGRITIDGDDLQDDVVAWQRGLGVVPQMVFLTDDTLRRNIALGVPDHRIDETAVRDAISLAQLDSYIESLPLGLDTVVGERGVRISGGQRQRIAIARALYRRARVLFFDEGTSALDNATEAELMRSLELLRGDHTIVLIAHRLSTVRNCDRIAYLEDGRLTGLDTYERLLAGNAGFRTLAVER
jgi:ATP-binding cassette, subfamily B, bacterial PglK